MKTIIGLFIIMVIVVFFSFSNLKGKSPGLFPQSKSVVIDSKTYNVEVATTKADQEKGLSGRSSLAQNHGMYFIFSQQGRYSFWMKDMKFPIDIIFINDNKIVAIFPNVPAPTSNLALPVYTPDQPANRVLETPAGDAKNNNFKIGDKVSTSL